MGRVAKKAAAKPRKARAEGEAKPVVVVEEDKFAADPPIDEEPFEQPSGFEDLTVEEIEAAGHPNPVPGDDGDALDRIAAFFRATYPDKWEELALCPLRHGLPAMANLMRGNG